jgi:hypothetical protein
MARLRANPQKMVTSLEANGIGFRDCAFFAQKGAGLGGLRQS